MEGVLTNGQLDIVRNLLKAGASPHVLESGRIPLLVAAYYGHAEIVQELLNAGADVNAEDQVGHTALFKASTRGSPETLRVLLQAGADLHKINRYGDTPLKYTLRYACVPVENMKVLLDAGANTEARDHLQRTALHRASGRGQVEAVRVLLAYGADIHARNCNGWTCLMLGAFNGHPEICQLLLKAGADVNAKSKRGGTALKKTEYALRLKKPSAPRANFQEVVRILREAGAEE